MHNCSKLTTLQCEFKLFLQFLVACDGKNWSNTFYLLCYYNILFILMNYNRHNKINAHSIAFQMRFTGIYKWPLYGRIAVCCKCNCPCSSFSAAILALCIDWLLFKIKFLYKWRRKKKNIYSWHFNSPVQWPHALERYITQNDRLHTILTLLLLLIWVNCILRCYIY